MTHLHADDSKLAHLFLALRIGKELHGIPISTIEEVLPALPIEPVPQCPSFVIGVVFVRGHLIPVLSAAERLGVKNHVPPDEPNIVCIRIDERIIGVEFDEAIDLIRIDEDAPLVAKKMGAGSGFFTSVVDHEGQVIRLLDPQKLLTLDELNQVDVMPGNK